MIDESNTDSDTGYKKSQSSTPHSDQKSPENDKKDEGSKEKLTLGDRNGSFQESTPAQQQSEEEESREEEPKETSTQANNSPNPGDESIPVSIVISDESGMEAFTQNPQTPEILVTEPPLSPPCSGSDPSSSSSESSEPEWSLGREYPSYYSAPIGNMSGQFSSRPNDNDAESTPGSFLTGSQNVPSQDHAESSFSTTGASDEPPAMVPGNGDLRFEDIQNDFRFEKMLYGDDTKIGELPGQSGTFRENLTNNNEDLEATKSENKTSTSRIEGTFDQKNSTNPRGDIGECIDKSNFDTVRDTRSFGERRAGRVEAMSEEEQIQTAIQASLGQPTNFDDPSPTLPEDEYTGVLPAANKGKYDNDDWLDDEEEEEIPLARVWSRSEEQSLEDLELNSFHKQTWLSQLDQNSGRYPGNSLGPESSRSLVPKSEKLVGSSSTSSDTNSMLAKADTSQNPSAENENDDDIYGISPPRDLGSQADVQSTTNQTSPDHLTSQDLTRELNKASLEREALREKETELREQNELLMKRTRILQEEVDLQEALRRSMQYNDFRWHTEGSSEAQGTSSSQRGRSVQQIELPTSSSRDTDRAQEFQDQYKKAPSELRYRRIRPRLITSQSSLESLYHAQDQRELPLRELESNLSSIDMSRDDTITIISNQKLASAALTVHDTGPVLMTRSSNTMPLQANHSVKPVSEDMKRTESKRLPAKQIHPSPLVQEHIMKNIDFLRPLTPMQPKLPKENVSIQEPPFPNNKVNNESEAMSKEKTVIRNPIRGTRYSNINVSISSPPSMEEMSGGQTISKDTPAPFSEDHSGTSSHIEDISSSPYSPCPSNVPLPAPQESVIPTMQELLELVNNPKNSPTRVQETPQHKLHFQAPGDETALLATSKKRKSAESFRIFKQIRQRRRNYWKQSFFQKERAVTQTFRPVPQADQNRCTTIIPHSDLSFSENISGVKEFVKEGRAWQKRRQYLDHNQHHEYMKFKTSVDLQSQVTTLRDSSTFRSDWQELCEEDFIARERKDATDEILKMTKLYDKVLHGRDSPSQNSVDLDKLDALLNSMYARGKLLNAKKHDATTNEDHIRYRVEQISRAQAEFVTLTLLTRCAQQVTDVINEVIPVSQKMHHVHGSSEPSQWLWKMHERREIRRITVKFLNGLRPDDPYDEFIVPPLGPYPHLKKEPRTMGKSTPSNRGRIYTNTQRPRVAKMAPGEGANKLRKYREEAQAQYGLEFERPHSVEGLKALPPLGTDTPRPGTFADPMNLNKVNDILMSDVPQEFEPPQDIQNTQDAQDVQDPQNPQERIAYEQRKIQFATKNQNDFEAGVAFDKPLIYPDNDPDNRRRLNPENHYEKSQGSLDGASENKWDRTHTGKDIQFAHFCPKDMPQDNSLFGEPAFRPAISPETDAYKSYKSTIARLEARHGRNKSPYPRSIPPSGDEMEVDNFSVGVVLPGAMDIDSPGNTLDLGSSPPDNINDLRAENKTLRNLIQAVLFQTSDEDLVSAVHRIRASENLEDDLESMVGLREVGHSPEDIKDGLETLGPVQHESTVASQQNNPPNDRLLLPSQSDVPPVTNEASISDISNNVDALLPSNELTKLQSPSDNLRRGGNTTASDIRNRLMKQRRSPANISMKKIEAEQPLVREDESIRKAQETGSETHLLEQEGVSSEHERLKKQTLFQTPEISSDDVEMLGTPQSSETSSSRDDPSRQNVSAETARPSSDGAQLGSVPSQSRKRSTTMSRAESDDDKDSPRKRRKPSSDDVEVGEMPSSYRKRGESMSRVESDDESPRKRRRTRLSRKNRDR